MPSLPPCSGWVDLGSVGSHWWEIPLTTSDVSHVCIFDEAFRTDSTCSEFIAFAYYIPGHELSRG